MSNTIIDAIVTIFAAVVVALWFAGRRRRMRMQREMKALLSEYFDSDMPADQLGRRSREIASGHFLSSPPFQAMAWAAYQGAAEAKSVTWSNSQDGAARLMRALGALQKEFGLPDRYRNEGWRAGRE